MDSWMDDRVDAKVWTRSGWMSRTLDETMSTNKSFAQIFDMCFGDGYHKNHFGSIHTRTHTNSIAYTYQCIVECDSRVQPSNTLTHTRIYNTFIEWTQKRITRVKTRQIQFVRWIESQRVWYSYVACVRKYLQCKDSITMRIVHYKCDGGGGDIDHGLVLRMADGDGDFHFVDLNHIDTVHTHTRIITTTKKQT